MWYDINSMIDIPTPELSKNRKSLSISYANTELSLSEH